MRISAGRSSQASKNSKGANQRDRIHREGRQIPPSKGNQTEGRKATILRVAKWKRREKNLRKGQKKEKDDRKNPKEPVGEIHDRQRRRRGPPDPSRNGGDILRKPPNAESEKVDWYPPHVF